MSELRVLTRAPSNIALIKYMGKKAEPGNIPENPSLSMTLEALCTVCELTRSPGTGFQWIAEAPRAQGSDFPTAALQVPSLSEKGIARLAAHLDRVAGEAPALLARFGLCAAEGARAPGAAVDMRNFTLRSANTFPAASGIASSASSFAAFTLAAVTSFARDFAEIQRALSGEPGFRQALAGLSRAGSGSSCRSFDGPWVYWEAASARAVPSKLPPLAHFVLVVSSASKAVSSSDAHQAVKSSPLWQGRPERAARSAASLCEALERGDLSKVARLAWSDAWEMHSLFHTCERPFSYWEPGTIAALQWLAPFVNGGGKYPPIVTLDAGPNVHISVLREQAEEWAARISERFPAVPLLRDRQGSGARVLWATGA